MMPTDRMLDDTIGRWLEAEAPGPLPDRVLRATFERTRTTGQQRGWRTHLGSVQMNKLIAAGLGTAALVVAVVVGAGILGSPSQGGIGGAPSAPPSPTATPSPTPRPSPTSPSSSPEAGLAAGRFALWDSRTDVSGKIPMTVMIPGPGWYGDPGVGFITKDQDADPPSGAGLIVFPGPDGLYIYGDPCRSGSTRPDTPATTVDEVVAALRAQASRSATAPVDVSVGGYTGKSITLHVPDDVDFARCEGGKFGSWGVPGTDPTPFRYQQGPGQIDKLWILTVNDRVVIIDASYYKATPQAVIDELDTIAESATFGT